MAIWPELEVVLLLLPSGKLSAVWACHLSTPDKNMNWFTSFIGFLRFWEIHSKCECFPGINWAPVWRRCWKWREQSYEPPLPADLQRPEWHQASLGPWAEIWKLTQCSPQSLAIGGESLHHSSWLEDFHSAKSKLNGGLCFCKTYICFRHSHSHDNDKIILWYFSC